MESYAYFNRPDVQEALHSNVTHLDYEWKSINIQLNVNYFDRGDVVVCHSYARGAWQHELENMGDKWRCGFGGADHLGSDSLQLLNLNSTVPWYVWYRYLDGKVGGYTQARTQGYDGLTFVTMRDAGHEVPMYEPARALAVFKSYITGESLPKS